MGLSSSKTKTTSNTSQNTNQQETGTTQPITPQWLTDAAQEYVGRIGAFGDMDPNGFVAPASPLQQMAWQNAGSLGDWRQQSATASQMAQSAGMSGANLAGKGGAGGAIGQYSGVLGARSSNMPRPAGALASGGFTGAVPAEAAPQGDGSRLLAADIPGGGGWAPPAQPQTKLNGYTIAGRDIMEGGATGGSDTTIQSGGNPLWGRPNAFSGASAQQPPGAVQQTGPAAYQSDGYTMPQIGQRQQASAYGDQGPAFTYQAPNVGITAPATAYAAGQVNLGAAPQASASSYNAPSLSAPGLVSGQGYAAPQLGQAGGYAAARTGAPIGASAQGYTANLMQNAPQISRTAEATATNANAGSLLDNFSSYQNPYTQDVVNASLADYDQQAARSRAALEAQGAAAGAFGGSRFGIAQGTLMGDQDRARASLEAGLRQQGFNTAAALSQSDAANRQQPVQCPEPDPEQPVQRRHGCAAADQPGRARRPDRAGQPERL